MIDMMIIDHDLMTVLKVATVEQVGPFNYHQFKWMHQK